jgi:hypothetical protein
MTPLMVSSTPMSLHSRAQTPIPNPKLTKMLKNMFSRSLPPKLPTTHINVPHGPTNGDQPSPDTTHSDSVFHPHDSKHQLYVPPQALILEQKWKIIIEKTVSLISSFTASNSTQMPFMSH